MKKKTAEVWGPDARRPRYLSRKTDRSRAMEAIQCLSVLSAAKKSTKEGVKIKCHLG